MKRAICLIALTVASGTALAVDVGDYESAFDDPDTFCANYDAAPADVKERLRERWVEWCTEPGPSQEPIPAPDRLRERYSELRARIEIAGERVAHGGRQALYVSAAGRAAASVSSVDVEVVLSASDLRAVPDIRTSRDAGAIRRERITVEEIPALETVTLELPADLGEGRYWWCAIVDPDDRVVERNERDNVACTPIDTRVAQRSDLDLRIERIQLRPQAGQEANHNPHVAAPGEILAFRVTLNLEDVALRPTYCLSATGPEGQRVVSSPANTPEVDLGFHFPYGTTDRYPLRFQIEACDQPGLPFPDANRANNEATHWLVPFYEEILVTFRISRVAVYSACERDGEGEFSLRIVGSTGSSARGARSIHQSTVVYLPYAIAPVKVIDTDTLFSLTIPGDVDLSVRAEMFESDIRHVEGGYELDGEIAYERKVSDAAGSAGETLAPQRLFEGRGTFNWVAPAVRGCGPTSPWAVSGTWTARPLP